MTRLTPTKTRNDAILDFGRKEDWDAHDLKGYRWEIDTAKKKPRWRPNNTFFTEYLVFNFFKSWKCRQRRKRGRGRKKRRRMVWLGWSFSRYFLSRMFLTCKETLSCFVCCFCAEKTELTIEDKYKRTMQEIEVLKDELGRLFKIKIF